MNILTDNQPLASETPSSDYEEEMNEDSARRPSVTIEEVEDEDGYGYCDYGDDEEGTFEIDDTIPDADSHLWEQDHAGAYLWETGPPESLERELFSKGVYH
jgi:hypothetical protein